MEHGVITFLKNHGDEIVEKGRYKYEPLRKDKTLPSRTNKEKEKLEDLPSKIEKLEKEIIKVKKENNKLKDNTDKEWYEKYKKYKTKYKTAKRELDKTKIELREALEEIKEQREELSRAKSEWSEELKRTNREIETLKRQLKRIKGKEIESENSEINLEKEERDTETSSSNGSNHLEMSEKIVNYIQESEEEEIKNENDQIVETLRRMKNVNAIIEEEPESDIEDSYNDPIDTEMETESIVNLDADDYPEEDLSDLNLEPIKRKYGKMPNHIPIGQQPEFREFIGSMAQGINPNGYFLDLDNVYETQEINRRITDWTQGTYLALMSAKQTENLDYVYDLISRTMTGKVAYWVESIAEELKALVLSKSSDWKSMLTLFEIILKREFLGEPWNVAANLVPEARKAEMRMNLNNMRCCKINKLPEYTISFTKFFYEARFTPEEGLIYQQLYYDHLPNPYNIEITKEYNSMIPRENTLGERIRVLRSYLMRKCEEYRLQQKVKKDKKLGLRDICGLAEKRLVFGCEEKRKRKTYKKGRKKYQAYNKRTEKYNKYNKNPYYNKFRRRRRFRRFKNTPQNRNKFRYKRKFRRKPYKKQNISECKCWNCHEKGHYANKCPKLKEKGIKYVNKSEFIMSLEQIREDNNKWYEYEEFYISETETEDGSETQSTDSNPTDSDTE